MQPDNGMLQGQHQGYFRMGLTQIQKDANFERAARNSYDKTCDYLDVLDKRIQRGLACHSKALSHMLQRELYTMGNSVLVGSRNDSSPI